jgi:hypothetical protein
LKRHGTKKSWAHEGPSKIKKTKKNMGTRMSKYIKIILYILKKIIAP